MVSKFVRTELPAMPYEKVSLDDVEQRDIDGVEPALRAIGYELRPSEMRPSVWEYAPGESNNRHRQEQQEELYVVLDGRLEMDVDDETVSLTAGDCVVVPPESWRKLRATEQSRVLVVGAPNVSDDGVLPDDA